MRIVDLDVTTLEGQILYMLDKVATKNAQVSALDYGARQRQNNAP